MPVWFLKRSERFDLEEVFSKSEDQSSLHCSTVAEESEGKRACMAQRSEHPIRHLRVVLKPIGSLRLRLKIDKEQAREAGRKGLLGSLDPSYHSSPNALNNTKDEKIG